MDGNRFFFAETLVKILALKKLRNCVLRHQPDEIVCGELSHPSTVEVDDCFLWIENLKDLRFVGLGILFDLLARERRTSHRTSRRIANHSGEIADQENGCVAEILKVLEFAE